MFLLFKKVSTNATQNIILMIFCIFCYTLFKTGSQCDMAKLHYRKHRELKLRIHAARMRSRVYVTVACPSVRLSVCLVDRQQLRRAAGLPLSAGAGSRYRSIAAGAAYRL